MSNTSAPAANEAAGSHNFLLAAWTHAKTFLEQHGHIATVMILGRYEDAQLLFVFPSRQDRAHFALACEQEAATFRADIAIMVDEGTMHDSASAAPVATVLWRERGQPIRAQYAALGQDADGGQPYLGPINSMLGEQANEFLETVFGSTKH